jgi:hypothetical protein
MLMNRLTHYRPTLGLSGDFSLCYLPQAELQETEFKTLRKAKGLPHRSWLGPPPITILAEETFMITRILSSRYLKLCLALAFLAVAAQIVLPVARAQDPVGLLTVTGMVKVNGKPAATGDIVASGSTVETAKGSSAVVSLGKLGRVEALPATQMKLRYDDSSISILIDTGSVRVSTGPGVAATITSKDD